MGQYSRVNLGYDSSGRPVILNRRTIAMLRKVEKVLGIELTIVQGSYVKNGADASASTHDGGGVIDIRTWDLPKDVTPQAVVRALRDVGFAAWYRTEEQGFDPHIHAVAIGDAELDPSARDQVNEYRAGGDGLVGDRPDPQPYRPKPIPVYNYWSDRPKAKISLKAVREEFILATLRKEVSVSKDVKRLQAQLNKRHGFHLKVDGLVGEKTVAAYRFHERKCKVAKKDSVPDDISLPRLLKNSRYRMVA